MAYEIDIDLLAREDIKALPREAAEAFAEALQVLVLVSERGKPINDANPDGGVYQLVFGKHGLITYPLLEDQRRVDVLAIAWVGAD